MFLEDEYCRSCGLLLPARQLSNRGLCAKCAMKRVMETFRQLQAHSGWIWEKWRRNYLAAMSEVIERLLEEEQLEEEDDSTT